MAEPAVPNRDILRRDADPPSFGVPAALERDAVVTLIETAVLDDDVTGHLDVHAIVVTSDCAAIQSFEPASDRLIQMDHPRRGSADPEILQSNVAAMAELNEMRPAFLSLVTPRPLRKPRRQDSLPGNRNVCDPFRIDQRQDPLLFHALPGGQYVGIIRRLVRKFKRRVIRKAQLAIGPQADGAGQPSALRHEHGSAARLLARRQRRVNRLRRLLAFPRAKVADGKRPHRDGTAVQPRHTDQQGQSPDRNPIHGDPYLTTRTRPGEGKSPLSTAAPPSAGSESYATDKPLTAKSFLNLNTCAPSAAT